MDGKDRSFKVNKMLIQNMHVFKYDKRLLRFIHHFKSDLIKCK